MKYYAVKNGRSNGVYSNWSDCESQVKGYSGNQYKSFSSKSAAEAYANSGSSSSGGSSSSSSSGSRSGGYNSGSSGSGSYGDSSSSYSKSSSSSSRGSSSYTPYSSSSRKSSSTPSYSSSSYSSSYYSPPSYSPSSSSSSSSSSAKQVNIYTDGASKNNQARNQGLSRAGYGVYYGAGDNRNHSGRVSGEQTNQRGELQAIHHALKNSAAEAKSGNSGKYVIHTDSQYSMDSISKWGDNWEKNGWKTSSGNAVVHQDLIKECRSYVKDIKANSGSVEFVKVKGHSGNHGNDMADKLAVQGCDK